MYVCTLLMLSSLTHPSLLLLVLFLQIVHAQFFFPSRFVVGEKSCDIFPFEFELFLNSVYWIFFLRVCSSSVQLQLPEC